MPSGGGDLGDGGDRGNHGAPHYCPVASRVHSLIKKCARSAAKGYA